MTRGAPTEAPASPDLDAAVAALRRDRLIVYPTETFYGLGARALSPAAVAACAAAKGRVDANPIAVIIAEVAMLETVVAEVPNVAHALIARFWPGALTLVLSARAGLPPELTSGTGTIGVRVSSHPVARALSAAVGGPITATSANRSGEPPACDVPSARDALGDAVDVYLDGGAVGGGLGSTVLLLAGDAARVMREGAVPTEALRGVLGAALI